ncbi:hypothetical protein ROHU_008308 [Labeo rohita]|uniref:Uncharacterized protein n=1 Tax=Labeo rohita TaxID=84645 RepID=A0A498M9U6_LABRO|nr:hypothetical protein ROHU_008308 [Labeo rohita]
MSQITGNSEGTPPYSPVFACFFFFFFFQIIMLHYRYHYFSKPTILQFHFSRETMFRVRNETAVTPNSDVLNEVTPDLQHSDCYKGKKETGTKCKHDS